MKNNRRSFLSHVSFMAGVAAFSKPLVSAASISKHLNTLHASGHSVTIFYTNDLHGKQDALQHINHTVDAQETSGLLLDAGDFLGEAATVADHQNMIQIMNAAGYHAATLGNHELALGQDKLAELAAQMNFKLVNCNYELEPALSRFVAPYVIMRSGDYRIGITGVGHQVKGVKYKDAIASANQTAAMLKNDEQCDMVICLSHLGFKQKGNTPDNLKLARESENIDMIISGHNRKLLKGPMVVFNKNRHEVIVGQSAWDGLMMGRTILSFNSDNQKNYLRAKHLIPGEPAEKSYEQSFANLRLIEKDRMAS